MKSLEAWMLSYFLNSLWQVPLLCVLGWLAALAARPAGASAEHRIWVSTSLLQTLLPLCSTLPAAWLRTLFTWQNHHGIAGDAHVSVVMGAGTPFSVLHLPQQLLHIIAAAYGLATAYFVARFLWRSNRVLVMRRQALPIQLSEQAALCWQWCCTRFGIHDATLAASSQVFSPVTMGLRRRLVLLPIGMITGLAENDLRTVIAHEFAHMHRQDFIKNFLYELLSLPVQYHPLSKLARTRVVESREMICDQMAAAISGRTEYAHSLLRLASLLVKQSAVKAPHAIGIFDANAFERRLMKLIERQTEMKSVARIAILAACAALGAAACGSALALSVHVNVASVGERVNVASPGERAGSERPHSLTVPSSVMAGNVITKVTPPYPEAAKKAKLQGIVVLHAVIGKDGMVEKLEIVSGPDELRQSALDAVRQWTYKPYLLNGDPIEVETTVNVHYSLQP